jgi:hypothetical protein
MFAGGAALRRTRSRSRIPIAFLFLLAACSPEIAVPTTPEPSTPTEIAEQYLAALRDGAEVQPSE